MRYAALTFFLGIIFGCWALALQGWFLILIWLSLCLFALSIGYARPGTNIFFKQPDGAIPFLVKVIYLPFFLYSHLIWHLLRWLSRERSFDQAASDLLLGRRLLASELPDGIHNYLDLTMEFEDPVQIRERFNYICLPILNGGIPKPESLLAAFQQLEEGPIYIHCARGHGRTAMVALCLQGWREGLGSFEEGLKQLKECRPGIHLNRDQREFIKEFISTAQPKQ